MKILFISNDLIGGNLAYLLKKEGHSVKLYIEDIARRGNFVGLVEHTNDWESELPWVGKNGLIVFDDVGYGEKQDELRKKGYTVFGGSKFGDKLEQDRSFGQEIFRSVGMKTVSLHDFKNSKEALRFVEKNRKCWVIKQNNHHYSKALNYIGQFSDGHDVIDILSRYSKHKEYCKERVSLQEKLSGVEIGIGRYFNGVDWVGPIEFNLEHPHFFPGNIGPLTSEMGTLAWYDTDESNRLYKETLGKMKSYLKEIDFRGDFEINFIVNKSGAYPLEATARLGSPIIHLHSEIHKSPWGVFLYDIASGKHHPLKWQKGYGIVTVLAIPPFPYVADTAHKNVLLGSKIYFKSMNKSDWGHVHFEEVSFDKKRNGHYISDSRGYVMYATSLASSVEEAQAKVQKLINKIKLTSNSGSICVELVKKAQRAGAKFRQVSIHHYERKHGNSQFFQFSRLLTTFSELTILWINLISNHFNHLFISSIVIY